MREQPSTESTLVDNLPVDQLLLVGYAAQRSEVGPISAEGFAWYPVIRLGELTDLPPLSDGPLFTTSAAGGSPPATPRRPSSSSSNLVVRPGR